MLIAVPKEVKDHESRVGIVPAGVKALVDAGRDVSYALIDSQLGHDDFLMATPQYFGVLRTYLARAAA